MPNAPDRMSSDDLGVLAALREQKARAEVALESVERLFVAKYHIGPQDSVGEDGTISRAQPVQTAPESTEATVTTARTSEERPRFPAFPFVSLNETPGTAAQPAGIHFLVNANAADN
jgi:hypothetical protein